MRHIVIIMASVSSLVLSAAAIAQTNRAGIDSNITPIVPDRQIGLPDKEPPSDGQVIQPEGQQRAASPKANPATAKAAAPKQDVVDGEWKVECIEKAPKPNCQATVRAIIGEQIALVLSVARQKGKPDPQIQLAVPLGMMLSKGVDVKLGTYTANFPISRCTAQGCLVEGAFPQPFADALKTGENGIVSIYSTDGKPVQLPLPAKSFAQAYESLSPTN